MEKCDVLIVGGGPAGSTCAWKLKRAGLDVLIMDKARFPRDKVCAGWITPEVLKALEMEPDVYRQGRTLQDIRGFRVGVIRGAEVIVPYGSTVSYGLLRSEFDHFLLERSGVRRILGEPVSTFERRDSGWLVNGRVTARLVVGAGGHFCPVARLLGADIGREEVIVAQAAEFPMDRDEENGFPLPADQPALFFCRDLKGYGWLFRKGGVVNIGLGRMDRRDFHRHMRDFSVFLGERGYLPQGAIGSFRGHAYLPFVRQGGRVRLADGALLIGDAAGLANPASGEGILPAINSALLAADVIVAAGCDYRRENLEPYGIELKRHFKGGVEIPYLPFLAGLLRCVAARFLSSPRFARHLLLDRYFLHLR